MTKMKISHHRVIMMHVLTYQYFVEYLLSQGVFYQVLNAVSDSMFLMKKWFHFKSKGTGSIGACRLVVVL